jgi:protein O-GlcNAc transferase
MKSGFGTMSALLAKARREYESGDHNSAFQTLSAVLATEENNAQALILTGLIEEKRGQGEAAARLFARAAELDAGRYKPLVFKAVENFIAAARPDLAMSLLKSASERLTDDYDCAYTLCALLREAGRYDEALPHAEFVAPRAMDFNGWLNAGIVLSGLGRYDQAYPLLLKAYGANPSERLALSEAFWCASCLCDFDMADRLQAELEAAYSAEGAVADIRENAFRNLTWCGDEEINARTSRRTAEVLLPPVAPKWTSTRERAADEPVRIGYLSCDFHDHATMALFAGVLDHHDRDRFEVYGICHTARSRRHEKMHLRFLDSVDYYIDILDMDDDAAAAAIRACELDILVDLKGYTQGSRIGIFCRRPAPVQVTYLGFPGSVAGAGIDYAITDRIVTPDLSAAFYQERLLRMPGSYQANDATRPHVVRTGTRADHGLPEHAVVFCSFNQSQKIRSAVFRAWMEILRQVEGSVLWLAAQTPMAEEFLHRAAEAEGVARSRIVFAPKVAMADHLQRIAMADVALDTGPYNGHTTTSDALWAGVPVVGWKGSNFAGRVTESLLSAVSLRELVAPDLNRFVQTAVELAKNETRRSELQKHLVNCRKSAPLFDTISFTRDFESCLMSALADVTSA